MLKSEKSPHHPISSSPRGVLRLRVLGCCSRLRQGCFLALAALAIQLAGTTACTAGDTGEPNGSIANTSAAEAIPQGKASGNVLSGGSDITWMMVPEPAAALLGGIGLLLILRRRRSS
ncbi:MAG: MYXO-CTERM sorting domain-containing protein [Verrucomicrobiota bacterium]